MIISRQLIVIYIVIGAAITTAVEGLQCYVCEDCNEYQDFKELSICGEITASVTQKPSSLMPELEATNASSTTLKPAVPELPATNASSTTAKPPVPDDNEDYLYEYSMEAHDDGGASPDKGASTTASPKTKTQSLAAKETTAVPTTGTTKNPPTTDTTKTQSQTAKETAVVPTTVNNPQTVSSSATTSVKPAELPQDYDYMEYEDPKSFDISRQSRASDGAFLKIDEPVCYMYRYYANNTVFTNRGCTTLLNANKFLTCQALSNGAPMVGCRVCSTDGCNKFDLDESGEDHLLSAGVLRECSAVMVAILGIVISIIV